MLNFLVTVEAELDDAATAVVDASKKVYQYVDGVVVNDVEPAFVNFFTVLVPAEVTALKPYVLEALQEMAVDLPALLAGGLGTFWAAVAPALALTATKAEAAGVAAAQASVSAALTSVVADAQVAAAAAPQAQAANDAGTQAGQ